MKAALVLVLAAALAIAGSVYFVSQSKLSNLQQENAAPVYDKQISRKYGAYSKIAYCPQASVQKWTCKDCKTYNVIQDLQIISNPKKDIFGYAFYDTQLDKIVLSWRGSIDFKNYVTDFTYAKVPYTCPLCEVHLGFWEGFKSIATDVHNTIQKLVTKYPKAKMTTTGHSLGAALSTISAIQLNKKFPKLVTQIHNFGCPRVGNQKLAYYIKSEIPTLFRVVHAHDIFTHLPEQSQNFAHYPWEVLYDETFSNYTICDDTGQDPTCSNSYSPNYNKKDHDLYFFNMDETNC